MKVTDSLGDKRQVRDLAGDLACGACFCSLLVLKLATERGKLRPWAPSSHPQVLL